VVFFLMFKGKESFGMIGAIAMASVSVGCIGNKNKEVADAPPPPPAAYPDTSGPLAGAAHGTVAPGAVSPVPSMASNAATNRASAPAPAPFSLREGEQLVPHQIQSGENLSNIAAKYNSSISRIQAANGMTDTKIFAGKTLQIPTSAPPAPLAQASGLSQAPLGGAYSGAATAPVAPTYSAASSGAYPSAVAPPSVPSVPTAPAYPSAAGATGGISAPPVPQTTGSLPGYPASTSYPRTAPTSSPSFPTPSFEGSRVQFSN
jgi:LysM repeat protein